MSFFLGVGILLVLIVIGVPVGFALGLAGIASMFMIVPLTPILALMTNVVMETVSSYVLITIPMFILMAEFLSAGGISRDLLMSCNRLLRKVRGGMGMACVLAGAVLASASGSSTASAATITRAAFPVMKRIGYDEGFSLGIIAISGTLAILIPPSIAFILYGLMTETSIGKLFLAGIIPGVLTALGYILTISLAIRLKPEWGPSQSESDAMMAQSGEGHRVWPIGLLIFLILAGLYSGVATPTEISALGALGALVISTASGRMTPRQFTTAVGNTIRTTAMIVTIIFSAHLFGYFISFTRVTTELLNWVAVSGVSEVLVMLLIVGIYLLLGMVMDQAAIIILTAPITTPLIVGLGYDPIWWGVIIVKTAEIGLVSPPMGLNVFVASAAAKAEIREGFKGVLPFIATELIILAMLLTFPQLSLALTG